MAATNFLNRFMSASRAGQSALQKIIDMYDTSYITGQERTALAAAESSLASKGLGGSTRPVAVSAGMRASFEDQRKSNLSSAFANLASYIQNDDYMLGNMFLNTKNDPIYSRKINRGKTTGAQAAKQHLYFM